MSYFEVTLSHSKTHEKYVKWLLVITNYTIIEYHDILLSSVYHSKLFLVQQPLEFNSAENLLRALTKVA